MSKLSIQNAVKVFKLTPRPSDILKLLFICLVVSVFFVILGGKNGYLPSVVLIAFFFVAIFLNWIIGKKKIVLLYSDKIEFYDSVSKEDVVLHYSEIIHVDLRTNDFSFRKSKKDNDAIVIKTSSRAYEIEQHEDSLSEIFLFLQKALDRM
jgi:hypothetical protein